MRQLLIILLLLVSTVSLAQNILICDSAFSRPNDTVEISMEINNAKPFISFQFDLQIPDKVTFIGYSVQLSNRSTNQVAIGNLVGNNTIRVLAYSPNNSAFVGNSGKVLSFKVAVGNLRGEFPLILSNAIIGDSLSANILTGIGNGILSVYPVGINENKHPDPIQKFEIIPNPVKEYSVVDFSLQYPSGVELILNDNLGRKLFTLPLGEFEEGSHVVALPGKVFSRIIPGTVYHLGLEVRTGKMAHSIVYRKILK